MAVSKTARLGLTRWTEDEDPWSRDDWDDDNAALEALAAIARTGLYAQRGSAVTYARSLFYATDQLSLWFSDGAIWRRLELPNLNSWPMLATVPVGSSLSNISGPQLGIDSGSVFTTTRLPGGATIDSLVICRGDDTPNPDEVYTEYAFAAIYDAITGVRLAITETQTGDQFFHDRTLSMPIAGAGGVWQVPKTGRYMIVVKLKTVGQQQIKLVGATMPETLASSGSMSLSATIDTAAEMPADTSTFPGYSPVAGIPWIGFGVTT